MTEVLLFAVGLLVGVGAAAYVIRSQQPPVFPPCRFERCPAPPPVVIPETVPVLIDAYGVPEAQPDEKFDVCVLHSPDGESVRRVAAPAPTMLFRQRGRLVSVKYVRTHQDADGRWHFTVEVPNG
jgi:hypothetical protein